MKKRIQLLSLLCVVLLSATGVAIAKPTKEYERARKNWVDSVMNTLTIRDQAAQLMVKACFPILGEDHIEKTAKFISEDHIGGITFSRAHPVLHAQTLNYFQTIAKTPIMSYMDAEWGVAMRLDSVVKYPRQMTLGAIVNDDLVYAMGEEIANQCKLLGIQMNYAPVVDVNNNPNNPVINSRSFGEDKHNVARKGIAYMKGMQDNGVLASAKHFPGHGDTDVDSHAALPLIAHDKKRLEDIELYPFREMIKNDVASIMVAHLNVPAFESKDSLPSSLSKKIVTKLLRKKMKFKGLILTDGLEMKGVTSRFPANSIPLLAFQAGNDIMIGVENPTGAIDEFEAAVNRGDVSKRALRKACRKVLEVKYDMGLNNFKPVDTTGLVAALNSPKALELRKELAAASLTAIRNSNSILPLKREQLPTIAYLEVGTDEGKVFAETLTTYGKYSKFSIGGKPTQQEADSIRALLQPFDLVLVGYHSTDVRPQYKYGVDPICLQLIESLTVEKKVVLSFFGLPYALMQLKDIDAYAAVVIGYDTSEEAQQETVMLLMGNRPAIGKLPVTINEKYPVGFGLNF